MRHIAGNRLFSSESRTGSHLSLGGSIYRPLRVRRLLNDERTIRSTRPPVATSRSRYGSGERFEGSGHLSRTATHFELMFEMLPVRTAR